MRSSKSAFCAAYFRLKKKKTFAMIFGAKRFFCVFSILYNQRRLSPMSRAEKSKSNFEARILKRLLMACHILKSTFKCIPK